MREFAARRGLPALLAVMALGWGSQLAAAAAPLPTQQDFALIARGRYLATAADCGACHTVSGSGKPFAGGLPIETPFGDIVAPNITPDPDTGIGSWSDDQFDAALREGKMPDGSRLYPAMPYVYYTRMTRADVLAIRAYLNSVAPVHNRVEPNRLPFPINIRASLWFWDELYFTPGEFQAQAGRSAEWNRGAYLVEALGHCGACHTPKTALGGDDTQHALDGYSIQGWFGPNITNDARLGLGNWSATDLVQYLKSGHNRFAAAAGPMAEEVSDSSSQMTDADLAAIAAYLKDRTPESAGATPTATPPTDMRMTAGAAIYDDLCSACHKPDGTGIPYLIPNLAASGAVASRDPTTLLHVVLLGTRSVATAAEPTAPAMPEYGSQLTDSQIAAVLTFIRGSWGHAAQAVTDSEVRKARSAMLPAH